ncbi:hypothetical protein I4F81_006946 [Pyropia yezoensis]|uniref:Uncharacterized protein n=1 Tax=Pyropia yezoensis TaxID=2788 RepID=A0ACC3C2R7_PYRYE|nr:hypothetical protein I4F81_006946 [Neopyropia yezoensis]
MAVRLFPSLGHDLDFDHIGQNWESSNTYCTYIQPPLSTSYWSDCVQCTACTHFVGSTECMYVQHTGSHNTPRGCLPLPLASDERSGQSSPVPLLPPPSPAACVALLRFTTRLPLPPPPPPSPLGRFGDGGSAYAYVDAPRPTRPRWPVPPNPVGITPPLLLTRLPLPAYPLTTTMSIVGAYATPLLTHPPRPPTPLPALLATALRGALASASLVEGPKGAGNVDGGGRGRGDDGGGNTGGGGGGVGGAHGSWRRGGGGGAPPVPVSVIDGLIVCPALAHPQFMPAHALAQAVGIPPTGRGRTFTALTVEAGGASPVAATLLARSWVASGRARLVAVVAGDAVASMATRAFLDAASLGPAAAHLPAPQVVAAYDAVAAGAVASGWVDREDLAAVAVVAAAQAGRRPVGVADVLASPPVGRVTTQWECARRADGAAAVLVGVPPEEGGAVAFCGGGGGGVRLLGEGGEASSSLVPPPPPRGAWQLAGEGDGCSSGGSNGSSGAPSRPAPRRQSNPPPGVVAASAAAAAAYASAGLAPRDIDYWSVYDCFPIAFLLGAVATGLIPPGTAAGPWIRAVAAVTATATANATGGGRTPADWPVNVGGGLLGGGAPWDAPALFGLVEAVAQLRGTARWPVRGGARTALCYGNGGVFSHAAVALLGRGTGGGQREGA